MRAKFVNEGHFADIDEKEILTKKYFDLQFNQYGTEYIEAYKIEEGISDMSDDEIENSEEFKNWYRYELEYRLEEALGEIDQKIKPDGTIDIWRIIMVELNWLEHLVKDGQRLGIYWAFKREAAEPHWGYNNDKKNILVLIKSSVKEEYVNWIETLRLNTETFNNEKEIRLFKNTPLKIEYMEFNLEPVDLKILKGKIFRA